MTRLARRKPLLLNHKSQVTLGDKPDLPEKKMSAPVSLSWKIKCFSANAKHLNVKRYCAALQSDVKGPQQSEQLYQQVDDKPAVVPLANTVLYPRTVVIEASDAAFTRLAMLRSHWLLCRRKR